MPYKQIIATIFQVIYYLIFARVILSWIPISRGGFMADLYDIIFSLTEPLLSPIRKLVPPIRMGSGYMDLAPIILILLLGFIARAI